MGATITDVPASPSPARRATRADRAAIGTTMAGAFQEDPFLSYLLPGRAKRIAGLPNMFGLLFKLGHPYGAVDVTLNVEAAAIWKPPGAWHIPFWQYITNGPQFLDVFGASALRAFLAMDRIERRHPHEPHWYLQAIGTTPALQGKGFGGVLLRHRLAMIDADGLPAYLEASKESNVPLYANFGFVQTGEIKMPNGPAIYPMWREARPSE